MTPIVSGLMLFIIFAIFTVRGLDSGYRTATALLPLGTAAIVIVGGLSVLTLSLIHI